MVRALAYGAGGPRFNSRREQNYFSVVRLLCTAENTLKYYSKSTAASYLWSPVKHGKRIEKLEFKPGTSSMHHDPAVYQSFSTTINFLKQLNVK